MRRTDPEEHHLRFYLFRPISFYLHSDVRPHI
jgi:hypothetical protein